MLHPWRCLRPGWMGLWATWSGGRRPCPWQRGWNQVIFKVPSSPNHSLILRFCEKGANESWRAVLVWVCFSNSRSLYPNKPPQYWEINAVINGLRPTERSQRETKTSSSPLGKGVTFHLLLPFYWYISTQSPDPWVLPTWMLFRQTVDFKLSLNLLHFYLKSFLPTMITCYFRNNSKILKPSEI